MDEQTKYAFDFARDTVKQFLTLATGLIALTITFAKDFVSSVPADAKIYALWSWTFMLVSVFFGLWSLMALTGSLGKHKDTHNELSINSKNISVPAGLQVLLFLIGLALLVVFGVKAT
jgi:uncharacterized membrane protein